MIPVEFGRTAATRCSPRAAKPLYREYPLRHTLDPRFLLEVRDWLAPADLVGEPFLAELVERRLGLAELQLHAPAAPVGLRELDLVVLDDLDTVAGRVAEVEAMAGQDLDAVLLERRRAAALSSTTSPKCGSSSREPRSKSARNWSPISRNAASCSLRSTEVGSKRSQ